MIKKLLFFTFFFLSSFNLYSQTLTQTLKGEIIDKDTQIPLIGATISILTTKPIKGTTSGLEGDFKLNNVPVGRHNIRISYIGYEEVNINQLLIGSGKEVVLNIEMIESITKLEEVTVIAKEQDKDKALNEMATVSARVFTVEETQRYAASFNDPARMAQSYAGVSTASDVSNEIVIRGNSSRGLLWRMEGIEIPNPNHFASGQGSSGGGVSILSNTMMSNSDFFTGAFPAEYGNALSGVFDIKLRRGNNEKREYALQVGILGMQAGLEGPFSKKSKASYLINYRYSSLGLINKMGFEVGDAVVVPKYQDAAFNINIPTQKAGRFTLFGLGGISSGGASAVRDSTQWKYSSDRYEFYSDRQMGMLGMSHTYLLDNHKTYFKTIIAYSAEEDISRRDSLNDFYEPRSVFKDQYINKSVRVNFSANHKFNPKHILRAGASYDYISFKSTSNVVNPFTNSMEQSAFQTHTSNVQSFVQWKWKVSPILEFNTGIRHTSFVMTNNHILEPRFGFRWNLAKNQALAYGMGLHSRLEPLPIYFYNSSRPLSIANFIFDEGNSFLFSPEENLRITQAYHHVLSYDWNFAPHYRLKIELYHQQLFNIPVRADSTSTLSLLNYNSFSRDFDQGTLTNKGRGFNYGMELTIEKFFAQNYYLLVTTSLFKSKYKALDGVLRSSRFNRNYIFNVVGGKEFPIGKNKEHILGLNGKLIWAGGNRQTPIDLEASRLAGREILIEEQTYEDRLPDFFRFDIGLSYRWNKPDFALITSLDIQNATNRANVQEQYYDHSAKEIRTIYQLSWLPVFNVRLEF